MPDLDGFTVAERIRQEPDLADATVMLLTSDVKSGDLARCRRLGISRHLVKPLMPSEVLNAMLLALGESVDTTAGPSSPTELGTETLSPRLHVLVAEDNAINQRLLLRLLEKLGHTAVVTSNGQEAVEMYEAGAFDLVLMDIQMPVMDGLAATAAIRERESQHSGRRRLPIVAVTAYAMRGDRERCLAAGMDEYLPKPIKLENLTAALGRLSGNCPAPATPEAPTDAEPATDAVFDLTTALTSVGGDRDLLDELLAAFARDAPARMDAVRQAIAGGDAAELMREAHSLKGALQVLGATTAAGLARGLEALGRAGDVSGASEIVAALDREVDRLLRYSTASEQA
jgi:two-component system, sensor histidine kinase and response regulator